MFLILLSKSHVVSLMSCFGFDDIMFTRNITRKWHTTLISIVCLAAKLVDIMLIFCSSKICLNTQKMRSLLLKRPGRLLPRTDVLYCVLWGFWILWWFVLLSVIAIVIPIVTVPWIIKIELPVQLRKLAVLSLCYTCHWFT